VTTLGRLEPAEAKTSAGRATVRLIGDGRSGTATITAFSGAATNSVDVNVGAAAAAFITATASPQSLGAAGGSSTITALVEDVQGNGIQGLAVSFSTTRGTLSPTTATTDERGSASSLLTTTQEATVTVITGGASAQLSDTVVVTVQ
jgi:adhesin/invasin